MSFAGNAGARPPRLSITALRSGETYYFPFTPESWKETVKANYGKQTILGMSHNNLQYSNTENHMIDPMRFFFRGDSPEEVALIHEGRKFLLSLLYPSIDADSIREGGPTRVLFIWPQMIAMTCVIEQISITHVKFNVEGLSTMFNAQFGFTEIRDARITAEEVREQGTQRSGAASSQLRDAPSAFFDYDFANSEASGADLRNVPDELFDFDFDFSEEG